MICSLIWNISKQICLICLGDTLKAHIQGGPKSWHGIPVQCYESHVCVNLMQSVTSKHWTCVSVSLYSYVWKAHCEWVSHKITTQRITTLKIIRIRISAIWFSLLNCYIIVVGSSGSQKGFQILLKCIFWTPYEYIKNIQNAKNRCVQNKHIQDQP